MSDGISFIVCSYNSACRLVPTLAHLAAQAIPAGLPWEVVVVDNGSTDDTAGVALREWPKHLDGVLRVVNEPKPGLSHARRRGWEDARYEVLSFVDDDNWVCPEWARLAVEVMDIHPEIGVCGGQSEAVCEVHPPAWFERFAYAYAVGTQGEQAGDITKTRGYVWGAGLTLRKKALQGLLDGGFRPMLTDRKGADLAAGGDGELCFALRLAGWKIWYDPRLKFRHFLPAARLNWNYLRRLHRGFGRSKAVLQIYKRATSPGQPSADFRNYLVCQVASLVRSILTDSDLLRGFWSPIEGEKNVVRLEMKLGRLQEILWLRSRLTKMKREISSARWRCPARVKSSEARMLRSVT